MEFKVHTLVDVTETKARRGEEKFLLQQQQNFMTMTQTLGLRVNPYFDASPVLEEVDVKNYKFGSAFKGAHKVWTFGFSIEYEGGLNVDMLKDDFDLVPFIDGLTETAKFPVTVFRSKDSKLTNIIFEQLDK